MLRTHAGLSLQPLCSRISQNLKTYTSQCSAGEIYSEGERWGTLSILHSYCPWEWSQAA